MRNRRCAELAEFRSAYVDAALDDADRELLLAHLAGCAPCRREIEDLRAVRTLLHRMGTSQAAAPTTQTLSSRLVSIAGPDAESPVWSRPFRRTRPGSLPSPRRNRRVRVRAAALTMGALGSAFGVLGYAMAPPLTAAVVSEPGERARSEFASTLTELPLSSASVNAVMMAPQSELLTEASRISPSAGVGSIGQLRISADAAFELLRRAAEESPHLSYSGTQTVVAAQGDQTLAASVQVSFSGDQGAEVSVFSRTGRRVVKGYVPVPSPSTYAHDETLALMASNYTLSGWTGARVAGRAATTVEASVGTSGPSDEVLARWWLDDASGIVLRQETYDSSGAVLLASGFTDVTVGDSDMFLEHLPPRLAPSTTTAALNVSGTADLRSLGWFCPDDLAGLSLIQVRGDDAGDPAALHLVFSDGVSTMSLFEQRGSLSGPPTGSTWDEAAQAHLRTGTPNVASWQSGGRVFTLVTDSSRDVLVQAVGALPHEAVQERTTMEQVRAGWVRIFDVLIG